MKVIKAYNNNIVLAEDHGRHVVAIGPGCGFNRKPGDRVDGARVETVFPFTARELERLNLGLLRELNSEDILAVKQIVDHAGSLLGYGFRSSMVFALVDHLRNYEPGRYPDDEHPFRALVKKVYPREYEAAQWTVAAAAAQGIVAGTDRSAATAVAIHFINNQDAAGIASALAATAHIQRLTDLVDRLRGRPVDRMTLSYGRFVTHLQFLINRLQRPDLVREERPTNLIDAIYAETPRLAHEIVDALSEDLEHTYDTPVGRVERGYLLIYVNDFTAGLMPGP